MKYQLLSEKELSSTYSTGAVTLTTVLAILSAAIIAVVVYKLFVSKKGSASVPGGWKFSWN